MEDEKRIWEVEEKRKREEEGSIIAALEKKVGSLEDKLEGAKAELFNYLKEVQVRRASVAEVEKIPNGVEGEESESNAVALARHNFLASFANGSEVEDEESPRVVNEGEEEESPRVVNEEEGEESPPVVKEGEESRMDEEDPGEDGLDGSGSALNHAEDAENAVLISDDGGGGDGDGKGESEAVKELKRENPEEGESSSKKGKAHWC